MRAPRDLARALSLADGFVLMPVEVQGPDVARALAATLETDGWPATMIEPTSAAGWGELVARLLDAPATGVRAVLVVGPRQPSGALCEALRLVNQRQDSIAEALARALLWAGPPECSS
jgi:hypothetical protein